MTYSVKIKLLQPAELEALLPVDRIVEIDEFGRCSLFDLQIVIAPSQIEGNA